MMRYSNLIILCEHIFVHMLSEAILTLSFQMQLFLAHEVDKNYYGQL